MTHRVQRGRSAGFRPAAMPGNIAVTAALRT